MRAQAPLLFPQLFGFLDMPKEDEFLSFMCSEGRNIYSLKHSLISLDIITSFLAAQLASTTQHLASKTQPHAWQTWNAFTH